MGGKWEFAIIKKAWKQKYDIVLQTEKQKQTVRK